jgi:four helix bundle protein
MQNEGSGIKNTKSKSERLDILERSIAYSLRIIDFCKTLEKTGTGRILGGQLLRSGTSIGANIHEAQGGQSKADFIAKISVAYKEAFETAYWLRVIEGAKRSPDGQVRDLRGETEQFIRILSSILLSAKHNKGRETTFHRKGLA